MDQKRRQTQRARTEKRENAQSAARTRQLRQSRDLHGGPAARSERVERWLCEAVGSGDEQLRADAAAGTCCVEFRGNPGD